MGLLLENFKMALASIRANKMRAFLTMLGIIIGISSVITITSIGSSVKNSMNSFISSFGKNRIHIYIKYDSDENEDESKFFYKDDATFIKEQIGDDIEYLTPAYGGKAEILEGRKKANLSLSGIDYMYIGKMSSNKIKYGRDFNENDINGRKNFVIVDEEFAKKLYNKANIVGKELQFEVESNIKTFTVIGVYKREKTIFDKLNGMGNESTEAFIPYTIYNDSSSAINIKLKDDVINSKEVGEKIKNFVSRYKRVKNESYGVESLEEQTGMINNMMTMLSLGLGAIAGISLVVGGIGIMNIMLVSVTERTKEIGIRKSLGARRKDILTQFMVESAILSLVGGIIGTILGLTISSVTISMMQMSVKIEIQSIIIAVVFSLAVGIFFGLYPANKAAKLDPIDALRYE